MNSHSEPRDDRRRFLQNVGATTATAFVATTSAEVFAQAPPVNSKGAPGKKKSPAPTSGLAGIKELLARKEPVAWVFTGDDVTQGAAHTKGFRTYSELFGERVRWELRRMRDLVINTAVSGDKADILLADLDWRVLHLKPDVVSIMLGTNDCALGPVGHTLFRKNLTNIIGKIMQTGALVVLNTPNTVYLKKAELRGDLAAYAQIVREIGEAAKLLVVDHYAFWERSKPDQEALLKWLDDEELHPGPFGHRALAKQLFTTLEIFDETSPICQLEIP